MNTWNYIYAACVIALGLILLGMALIECAARNQERRARKKPHECAPEKSWGIYSAKGELLGWACEECEDEKLAQYPNHILTGDNRPMEER